MAKNAPQDCVERLRLVCQSKCLTQADLALVVGKSRTVVSNYLSGKLTPSFLVLQKLGASFRIDMNWLFFGEGEMFRLFSLDGNGGSAENAAGNGKPKPLRRNFDVVHDVARRGKTVVLSLEEATALLKSSRLCLVKVEGVGPDEGREIVVTRGALDTHEEMKRMVRKVCEIMRGSGVEEEAIRKAAEELSRLSVDPLAR